MNTVHLLGRLTGDPELRKTPSGTSVASFSVAVNRLGKDNGTDFISCVAWRESGESIARYFTKGKPIAVAGRLRTESYKDKQGNNRNRTEVVVDRWEFVPSDNTSNSIGDVNSGEDFQEVGGMDDLPF